MSIHPTAIVPPSAKLGNEVSIGPYAIVEDGVEIGDRCVIEGAAQLRAGTMLGADNFVGAGAIVGSDPQFHGFDRRIRSGVRIGAGNVLREHVTVHRSIHEGGETRLGDGNFLMTGAHVGHDTVLGDHNTLANNTLLAGHVEVGNHCFFGGGSAFHQFVRVGDHVMVQGHGGFSLDLPPYVIGAGVNFVVGINSVGLRRAGFSGEDRQQVKAAFREVFHGGKTLKAVLEEASAQELPPVLERFYGFLRSPSKKGFCIRTRTEAGAD